MVNFNISLPDNLRDWVDARIKNGDYNNASDYLRDLIRNDQKKYINLDEFLLEGLNSGAGIEMNPEFWNKKRQQLRSQVRIKR